MLLPDLHTGFSRGRSGGLVFPSLSEFFRVLPLEVEKQGWVYFTVFTLINTLSNPFNYDLIMLID